MNQNVQASSEVQGVYHPSILSPLVVLQSKHRLDDGTVKDCFFFARHHFGYDLMQSESGSDFKIQILTCLSKEERMESCQKVSKWQQEMQKLMQKLEYCRNHQAGSALSNRTINVPGFIEPGGFK